MLDRRDFEAWWARELARAPGLTTTAGEKYWAEVGFFASQSMLRNHVHNQQAQARKTVPALLGNNHGR